MVHANVGQKYLNRNIYLILLNILINFFLSGFVIVTLLLVDATNFSSWLLFGHLHDKPVQGCY